MCEHKYKNEKMLNKHENTVHQKQSKNNNKGKERTNRVKENIIYRDQCEFLSTTKKILKKHASQIHENQNPINKKKCDQCNFQFTSEHILKEHVNMNLSIYSKKSDFEEAPEVTESELDEWIAKARGN